MSGSPLDDIFDRVRNPEAVPPLLPIHARVLELDEGGSPPRSAWVFAAWSGAGDLSSFHRMLRERVEAALLARLSSDTPTVGDDAWREPSSLRLAAYVTEDISAAVRAFGFRPDATNADLGHAIRALLRGEAQTVGAQVPDEPVSLWTAPVTGHAERPEGAALPASQLPWGAEPGKRFQALLGVLGIGATDPVEAFREAEARLVSSAVDAIRWPGPTVFQALADGAGVVLAARLGAVAWGVSEPDDTGLAPPPVLRLGDRDHLPIGLELLRWCVMPLSAGEAPPSFTDWLLALG